MSSSNQDNIVSQTTGPGGSLTIGIVLGVVAVIFIIIVLLFMYAALPDLILPLIYTLKNRTNIECSFLHKTSGECSPDDMEPGDCRVMEVTERSVIEDCESRMIASLSKLDVVAPNGTYGKNQEQPESEAQSSCSFDNVAVW